MEKGTTVINLVLTYFTLTRLLIVGFYTYTFQVTQSMDNMR